MSCLSWIALGLLAGFIGSKILNHRGEGIGIDIALGILGAVIGGFLFNALGARGISGYLRCSICVISGGVVLLIGRFHKSGGGFYGQFEKPDYRLGSHS